jgi:hypothetical protein
MSFIDLKANDTWSDGDIERRVNAIIRSKVTAEDELKAARLARSEMDEDETAFVNSVDEFIRNAIQEGRQAKADMTILKQVFVYEAAETRLAQYKLSEGLIKPPEPVDPLLPPVEPPIEPVEPLPVEYIYPPIAEFILDEEGNEIPNPDWALVLVDNEERAQAQAVIDAVTPEVLEMYQYRHP